MYIISQWKHTVTFFSILFCTTDVLVGLLEPHRGHFAVYRAYSIKKTRRFVNFQIIWGVLRLPTRALLLLPHIILRSFSYITVPLSFSRRVLVLLLLLTLVLYRFLIVPDHTSIPS